MATFETLCAKGHHYIIFNVWEISTDTGSNSSKVGWSIQMRAKSGWGFSTIGSTIVAKIDGQEVYNVYEKRSCSAGSTVTWASGETTVYHNADGTKTAYCECAYTQSSTSSYTPGNGTASGNIGLTNIPRYANITTLYTSNIGGYDGLHGLYVTWNADASCDHLQYSLDGGGWTDASGYPTFAVWGLAPNTTHTIRIRVKRQDSQLWTPDNVNYSTSGKTKDINKISSGVPNITNGQALRVTASNPSGANCQIVMEVPAGSRRIAKQGTDVTFSAEEVNSMMQYMGLSTSSIRVTADTKDNSGNVAYSSWSDGTYTIVNSDPTFNHFEFEDINEKTLALTGNNKDCIKDYSTIKATIPVSSKAVAKNYATMSKYRLTIGGNTTDAPYSDTEDVSMELANASSGIYTVHAIDSRGLSTKVELLANNVIDYEVIKKGDTITAIRTNEDGEVVGTSELVKLSFNGSIWYNEDGSKGNFGVITNSIKSAKYRFKPASQSEWTEENTYKDITVTLNADGTFTFDSFIEGDTTEKGFNIENAYNIEVVVEDELSSTTYTANLGSGTPHVAYARNGVSIMGKYNDTNGGKFQIAGKNIDKILENANKYGGYILYSGQSNGTITLTDSAENYTRFVIYYISNDGWYNSAESFYPNNKNLCLMASHEVGSTLYIKHRTVNIVGKNIWTTNSDNYAQVNLYAGGIGFSKDNFINITGVVGYKY